MAELDVKERQAGDVTILDLTGEVRIGEGAISLRDSIRTLADQGKQKRGEPERHPQADRQP